MNNTSFIITSFPKNAEKFKTFITSIMLKKPQFIILNYNINRFKKLFKTINDN